MTHLPCSMSTDAETTVRMGRAESGNCGGERLPDGWGGRKPSNIMAGSGSARHCGGGAGEDLRHLGREVLTSAERE